MWTYIEKYVHTMEMPWFVKCCIKNHIRVITYSYCENLCIFLNQMKQGDYFLNSKEKSYLMWQFKIVVVAKDLVVLDLIIYEKNELMNL